MFDTRIESIDFDELAELARNNPEAFEARRQDLIEDFLSQVRGPHQHRLRCLQWRVDVERKRAANPMAACIKINQMMWDSLIGENGLRETLNALYSAERRCEKKARIVPFPGHHITIN